MSILRCPGYCSQVRCSARECATVRVVRRTRPLNEQARIAELERKLNQPPMARMFGMLMTPEALPPRALGRQQLLMAEVSRCLPALISPDPTQPDDAPDAQHAREVPID